MLLSISTLIDLANIKDTGALFVRKVSKGVDPNLINILPVTCSDELPYIQWPAEVKISEKMDWEPILAHMDRLGLREQ